MLSNADPHLNANYMEKFKSAIRHGNVQILELLKSKGMLIPHEKHYYPFHEAVKRGHLQVVDFFIQNGQYLEERDMSISMYTPLQEAIFSNNIKMIRFLISKGADVNAEYWTDGGEENIIYEVMRNVKAGEIAIEILRLLMNSGLQIEDHDIRAEINVFLGSNIKKNDNAGNTSMAFLQSDAKRGESENNVAAKPPQL